MVFITCGELLCERVLLCVEHDTEEDMNTRSICWEMREEVKTRGEAAFSKFEQKDNRTPLANCIIFIICFI